MAAPISQRLTSMPAFLMPASVASCTAFFNGSNFSLNVIVHAQSIIRPCNSSSMSVVLKKLVIYRYVYRQLSKDIRVKKNHKIKGKALAHEQLGHPEKGRSIKGFEVCWNLLNLISLGVCIASHYKRMMLAFSG